MQRQKNPVGVSALPTGKFLRVRKVFTRTTLSPKTSQTWHKFLDSLESFLTVWKASEQTGEYPDSLESVRKFWKVSGQSGKFPDSLESFWIVWKLSRQSWNFPDSMETFQTGWKVSGKCRNLRPVVNFSSFPPFLVCVCCDCCSLVARNCNCCSCCGHHCCCCCCCCASNIAIWHDKEKCDNNLTGYCCCHLRRLKSTGVDKWIVKVAIPPDSSVCVLRIKMRSQR